jgi:hypothetical protein
MVLLTKVETKDTGLEGLTEDGEWIPLRDPKSFGYRIHVDDNLAIEKIKKNLREKEDLYCELAGYQNTIWVTSERGVLHGISYMKRKIE